MLWKEFWTRRSRQGLPMVRISCAGFRKDLVCQPCSLERVATVFIKDFTQLVIMYQDAR